MPAREEEVEGQVMRVRGHDGTEYEIPSDRVIGVRWTDEDGEHEVEGHAVRIKGLEQESEVDGHAVKIRILEQNGQEHEVDAHSARVRWRDDSGQEQEVEGHAHRYSDLRLKRDVEPLRVALGRLRAVRTA